MKVIVSAEEMRRCDRATISDYGVPALVLMERAALAVVREYEKRYADKKSVLVICGAGNNGGDGFAIARLLHLKGYQVAIYFAGEENHFSAEAKTEWQIAKNYQIPFLTSFPENDYDAIVDALFGIGLSRDIAGTCKELMDLVNSFPVVRVAVDLPSGISADTGKLLGCAFCADLTVTFAYGKTGQYLYPGYQFCGEVVVCDVGINTGAWDFIKHEIFALEHQDLCKMLPERNPHSHKGIFGKVLVVAGCSTMAGAAYFAAAAAYRMGCGLVKVFTCEKNRCILQEKIPEAILTTYEEDTGENEVVLCRLRSEMEWADIILAGPGLGLSDLAKEMVAMITQEAEIPVVFDADALTAIAQQNAVRYPRVTVLTPHPGELARLTDMQMNELCKNFMEAAAEYAKKHACICVGKTDRTITATPEGITYINLSGNHGMATAGSGDVLSGIIAGLLAQRLPAETAAPLGVYLHGLAGDCVAKEKSHYGLMAGDLLNGLTTILRQVENNEKI